MLEDKSNKSKSGQWKTCMSDTLTTKNTAGTGGNQCYRTVHISHMEPGRLQTWQLFGNHYGLAGLEAMAKLEVTLNRRTRYHFGHSIEDARLMKLIGQADDKE